MTKRRGKDAAGGHGRPQIFTTKEYVFMLCLKLNKGEAVRFFDAEGREVGLVSFDRPNGHSLNSVRISIDFDKSIKIYRDDVLQKNPGLAANLTFRGE